MKAEKGGLIALGTLAIAICVLIYLYTRTAAPEVAQPAQASQQTAAVFSCPDGRSINASFANDAVKLTLSDGREFSLPRAVSADGARYANADESFVFWNTGTSAVISEGGTTTFQGCVTKQD